MRCALAAAVVSVVAVSSVRAQSCGHWSDGYAVNDLGGRVQASVVFDDGTGSHLYAAGEFRNDAAAPGRQGIAEWNGSGWAPVGGGLDGPAWALAVFDDDGAGPDAPALYVAGAFQHAGGMPATGIAKWDGHNWSAVGLGITGTVYALKAFDDGTGPGLYAGGDIYFAGTGGVSGLAVWRNGAWSDVGGGVMLSGFSGIVESLEAFQGSLYVGGFFDQAGAVTANAVARWDGAAWSTLGTGVSYAGSYAEISRMLAVDLPSTGGPALIVAGTMDTAGGAATGPVAKWTGSAWGSMNSGPGSSSAYLNALCVYDDGSGPALFAGGVLPPGSGISKWNGTAWTLFAAVPFTQGVPLGVDTMTVMGGTLYAGGMFRQIAGMPAPFAAWYTGGAWSAADAFGRGPDAKVNDVGAYNLGDGQHAYIAGSFRAVAGVAAAGVARYTNSGAQALATTIVPANATIRRMAAFDDGSGVALYVAGSFTSIDGVAAANVARWRPGSGWSAVGAGLSNSNSGTSGAVNALCVHDDDGAGPHAPALYATGQIQYSGAAAVANVVKWTGSAWVSVGGGGGPAGTTGACLASIDLDGAGGQPAKLYFGGVFLPISSWNGTAWTPDATTPTATVVSCIGGFDVGDGMKLYAGGDFTAPFHGSLARLGASGWENVGISPRFPNGGGSGGSVDNGAVQAMTMFDDGGGPQLYITGIFGSLFSEGYQNAARFNGFAWTGLGGGLASRFPGTDGRGTSMAVYDDGSGPALYIGGKFERFYPNNVDTGLNSWHAAYNLEKWPGCAPPRTCCNDFDGDGSVGTDADISAFFACLAGNCCPTCCQADFNGDGDVGTDADIESFFRVLAGGSC